MGECMLGRREREKNAKKKEKEDIISSFPRCCSICRPERKMSVNLRPLGTPRLGSTFGCAWTFAASKPITCRDFIEVARERAT